MSIVSEIIVCPRCKGKKLHLFGKDPLGFQKYRCLNCKRQFAPESSIKPRSPYRKHPACPLCAKASFLHHDYTYYSNYRCCDKKCNHSFCHPKDVNIKPPSSELFPNTPFSMKRMRHPLYIVLAVLNYYFMGNVTTRKAAQLLFFNHQVKISHVTVSKWIKRFAPVFQTVAKHLKSNLSFSQSDEWHFDETYIKIEGINYFLWMAIDSETRFILDFHLSPYRDSDSAHTIVKACNSKYGSPAHALVSDRYHCYAEPIARFFPKAKHIKVNDFNDLISNNIIEAFNNQFKAWYKPRRGFGSFDSANRLIATFIFFYNFIRPHSSLNGLTPAQVAGDLSTDRQRSFWMLTV